MFNGDFYKNEFGTRNSQLRQEYNRKLRERIEERQLPTVEREILPPIPVPALIAPSEEENSMPPMRSAPSILQKIGTISFSQGDWLILGLLVFFLFLTDDTDYILVGILAYLLLSD